MGTANNIGVPSGTPPVSTGTSLGDVGSSVGDPLIRRLMESEKGQQKKADEAVKKIDEIKYPEPPKLIESPKPQDYQHSPMEAFGSGAMWLATFGSLLSKQPLTNALNSGAAVMKAHQQQDDAAFQKAMEKWKVDTQNAKEMLDYQKELYKDMVGKSVEEQKILASAYKDEGLKMAIEARIQHDHDKAIRGNSEKITGAIQKQTEFELRTKEYTDGGMSPADARHKAYDEVLATSPEVKQTREEQDTSNLITHMDKVANDIIHSGTITTGAASLPGQIVESVGGMINPKEADTRIAKINSQLATIKLELAQRMKAGRLKVSQERLDEMIPSKGFHSVPDAVAGLNEVRNMLATDFDMPEKSYDLTEGNVPGIIDNASQNAGQAQNIKSQVIPPAKAKSLLDQFTW